MTDTQRPDTAVIILNWNGEHLLRRFLPSVVTFTPPESADIIVADNGSTDGSLKLLAERYPSVKVMAFDRNYGFAEGYNMAVSRAGYRYTVLLNSDAEATPGWLEPLVECMESNPGIGACQPKIIAVKEPGKFEYAGAAGGFLDRLGYPYCRGRIFDEVEADEGQYDSDLPADIFWASGAALMVRTAAYEQAGGLDPTFFAHMEEIDLCWRMRLAGYGIAAVSASKVRHLGGASLDASDPKKTYLNFRNNLLMMHKNLPPQVRSRRLLMRRLLDAAAWGRFVVGGKWRHAAAVVKAHRHFSRMRRDLPTAPADAPDLLCEAPNRKLSIVAAHYIRGVKKFSDL